MKKHLSRLLLLIVAPGFSPSHARSAEPLPPRAVAQIGDHRFYHGPGITDAVLSPDGKRIASVASNDSDYLTTAERDAYNRTIVLWDAATGERLREMRVPQGDISSLTFLLNGKRLAASYQISEEKSGVVLFDVESGELVRRLDCFPKDTAILRHSADGKQLWVSEWYGSVSAWDAATGKQLRRWKPPPTIPYKKGQIGKRAVQGVLSPDGKVIVWEISGSSLGGCASTWMDGLRVHDAATNKLLYEKKFRDPNQESEHDQLTWSFAFTCDGKRLVADCDKFVVWEAATGKERTTFKAAGMVRFTLAPDGRRAVIEEAARRGKKSRLRLWDIESGKPLRQLSSAFEDLEYGCRKMLPVFSADGKTLLFATNSTLRLFDIESAEEWSPLLHRAPIVPRFSADGRTLFTTCAERRCRWNVAGKEPNLIDHEPKNSWELECLTQSADGQLFVDAPSEQCVRVRATSTGHVLHTLSLHASQAALSVDAKRLLLYYENSENYCNFQLYDISTGKKSGDIKNVTQSGEPIFSPNGRFLAWIDRVGDIHLHDAVTGKIVRTLHSTRRLHRGNESILHLRLFFSPDGDRLIASGYFIDYAESSSRDSVHLPIRVFQVSTGREIARFFTKDVYPSNTPSLSCSVCSPDNRLLAVAEEGSGVVRLLEITSGKVRAEFAGHLHGVHGLDFSPDGKTLASGGDDNVVYLWDVTGAKTLPAKEGNPAACWNDLASDDGKRAGEAIASFLRKPEASVAFLKEKLQPAKGVDEKRLRQWITDLDADAFETREAASRELIRLGERVEDALRRELKNRPTLEVRRRIENVLSKLEPSPPSLETLQVLRAIEVLEHIGTPEARRCLEAMGKGAADARETREAKAALRRWTK